MTHYLQFQEVSFSYERTVIFSRATFEVEQNAYIGIIGPNGGGKTTLLKLLMGLLLPDHGLITIDGKTPEHMRTHIGYVPQFSQFDRNFPISVLDVVLMGALSKLSWFGSVSKKDVIKAHHALDLVDLRSLHQTPFGSLSGGQAQRVLIARALMSSPKLLILDEPTASIDVETEGQILQILKNLKGSTTILMVTHDLQAIMQHVDQVFCVQNGVSILEPSAVCKHFAYGVYHTPLIQSSS